MRRALTTGVSACRWPFVRLRLPALLWPIPLTVTLLAACPIRPASADVFGPISLLSESATQQADYARDPAISGDGRYVAFDGSVGGVTGVWRKDLETGAVEQVAGGDAQLPSISQNGQYVSFTTTARLSPRDHNDGPDVYVADLQPGSSEPQYELASAVDGSEEGLSYEGVSDAAHYGAWARGRYALSADGRKVAFVTTAASNLAGPGTPPLEVAVRDLATHVTQLVSVAYPPSPQAAPVPAAVEGSSTYGAVYVKGGQIPEFLPREAYASELSLGASISADGSTVAWLGQQVGEQARVLGAERLEPRYAEPLWRRIADGPLAPSRRITGGSDPEAPACEASGEQVLGAASPSDPCQGPFATFAEPTTPGTSVAHIGDLVPCLSGDGYTAAFLATAPLVSFGSDFGITEDPNNLYLVDMRPGLTRDQALRVLTVPASGLTSDLATNAPIVDMGISTDGSKVAFTTMRTIFPLGSPAYVSAPSAVPGMAELFDVDLSDETLTRVTVGYEGGAGEHPHEPPNQTGEDPYFKFATDDGALSPSYTSDGDALAFSSTASNLVYGDGNTPPVSANASPVYDGADVFGVSRVSFAPETVEGFLSPPPQQPAIAPSWRLDATARSRPDGSVVIEVNAPAAGSLRAGARAAVVVAGRGASSSRSRRRRGRGRTAATVAMRAVASASAQAPAPGALTIVLRASRRYAPLAAAPGGLSAEVTLLFAASGHPPVRERLSVSFARTVRSRATRSARRARGWRTRTQHRGGRRR